MKLLLDADEVLSGQTTNHTRAPAQQVHNSYSDRWIVLNFLHYFAKAVFHGVTMKSLLDANNAWSGQTSAHTRVPAQQVHNSWSDYWIVLKFLQEFVEDVLFGFDKISLINANDVWSGQTTDQSSVPAQHVQNSWSDRWMALKSFQEFAKAVFLYVAIK